MTEPRGNDRWAAGNPRKRDEGREPTNKASRARLTLRLPIRLRNLRGVGHVAGIIVVNPTLVYIVGATEVTMVNVTAVLILVGRGGGDARPHPLLFPAISISLNPDGNWNCAQLGSMRNRY